MSESIPISLLESSEPEPYTLVKTQEKVSSSALVLCCEHASNRVPVALNNLGLTDDHLNQHIAIDIGAAALTQRLSDRLGAQALLAGYSRLVVDLNRYPTDPGFIVQASDGCPIPGNRHLSPKDQVARTSELFHPYHDALALELSKADERASTPERREQPVAALVSIHSFTPSLRTTPDALRPWDVGVLWNNDDRLSQAMLSQLRRYKDICVGANQPYSGKDPLGYTLHYHGERVRRPYLMIEVRQDLIDHEAGVRRWSDILSECITRCVT